MIELGTLAWIMSGAGVIHRARYEAAGWALMCTPHRVLADERWRITDKRPRDPNICKRCQRACNAQTLDDNKQPTLFTEEIIDGRSIK